MFCGTHIHVTHVRTNFTPVSRPKKLQPEGMLVFSWGYIVVYIVVYIIVVYIGVI